MSQPNVEGLESLEDAAPVPDYELDQYFPERRDLDEAELEKLRDQHGYFRTYFLTNPDRFRRIQRWLNQGRFGQTYDAYLADSARWSLGAAALGGALGLVLAFVLASGGVVTGLVQTSLVPPVAVNVLVGLFLVFLGITSFGGGLWTARYYYPRLRVSERERELNVQLPHAIVYMYALSRGGMNAFEVISEVAEAEEVYGEVSNEFDMVVRDVELFGNDLFTAIRDARNLTPSDNMEQFFDDMISVLDSGSDFSAFLENEAETYMEEARQEQDEFLETLSILSEIFVVAFVAAPLFLIVTLLVISLLGGQSLLQTYGLVYVAMPLGMVAFLVVVDMLASPFSQHDPELEVEYRGREHQPQTDAVEDDPHFEEYERVKRRDRWLALAGNPLARIRQENPIWSLLVTAPLALLSVLLIVGSGVVEPTASFLTTNPIVATVGLFVVPFLVLTIPLTVLYELQRRRSQRIASRFPETLNILSSANQMGIPLTDSLDLVARWSDGALADELRKVRNDITWNHDVERALLTFANRLQVPQVTRTMKLIAKGVRSSSDITDIVSIAAEDTRNRYKLESKRRSEMSAYIAIVVIGFLVYLAVIVLMDTAYLTPISQISVEESARQTAGGSAAGLFAVGDVPVQSYRTVFFHSALIMGIGTGLLAGKLADDRLMAGLKYAIVLVAITLAVFAYIRL